MEGVTKNAIWAAVVILTALIEATWLGVIRLQGVLPDLILLLVVYFALTDGTERAMFTGFLGGIFQDVAGNSGLGHHVLCLVVVAYIVGGISRRLVTDQPAIKAALVFGASILHGILYVGIAYVQNPSIEAVHVIMTSVLPGAFYTALLTPFVFLFLKRSMRVGHPVPGGAT